ncbi:MAG: hypothetical protein QOD63_1909 [Actinomycetota bacterium]|jgi:hypothetical protein|nr:hypothetical protein [Actinomycetota bacterium]
MGSSDEREQELAELLSEVRALRASLDELKTNPAVQAAQLPPNYAVAVRQAFPPEYAVAVRRSFRPPDYAVMVRVPRPFDELVDPIVHVPTYNVAVNPPFVDVENPIVDQ